MQKIENGLGLLDSFDAQDVLASVLAHGHAGFSRSSLINTFPRYRMLRFPRARPQPPQKALNAFLRGLQTRAFPRESRIFRSYPLEC